jgi:hypothetical protein
MAGFSFGPNREEVWIVAGWAFRGVLRPLRNFAEKDGAFVEALDFAEHLQFLDVASLEPELQMKMLRALRSICNKSLENSVTFEEFLPCLDAHTKSAFIEGIRMLQNAMDSFEARLEGGGGWNR